MTTNYLDFPRELKSMFLIKFDYHFQFHSFQIHPRIGYTILIDWTSPSIYLGAVQLIPTATTRSHKSAIAVQFDIGSPLTTLIPSLELKENQVGTFMFSSSRILVYSYIKKQSGKIDSKTSKLL